MEIEFLEMGRGVCPVQAFLDDLREKARKKILRALELFESYDVTYLFRAEIITKMPGYERYNLYEFRVMYQNVKYRVLCCIRNATCYLVHAFIKKTQKTPLKEIKIAIDRIQQYLTPAV